MTRRTNYRILEGTKDNPRRIVVRVGSHTKRYGRVSLPNSLVGKLVEIIIPAVPIDDSVLGEGEAPNPVINRKPKKPDEAVVATVAAVSDTATSEVSDSSEVSTSELQSDQSGQSSQ